MNVVEKLGITDGIWSNKRLVESAPEMLEALIDLTIDSINTEYNEIHPRYSRSYSDTEVLKKSEARYELEIRLIQAATGKTWEEIKELLP